MAWADEQPRLISDNEAWSIVEAERLADEKRDKAMRERMNAVTVLDQNIVNADPSQIIVRRVTPPVVEKTATKEIAEASAERSPAVDFEAMAQSYEDMRPHEMISISVTVYGKSHSRVVWRNPDSGDRFTLWVSFPLRYLSPISSFEGELAHYSYFGFTELIRRKDESALVREAEKLGYDYQSRWLESPVPLSEEYAEYVIEADSFEIVPDKLYEQVDSLLSHYLEREDELEIAHRNAEKMRRARAEYEEKNPKAPKPSITNFWPGKNSSYQSAE
jgi:hypothetical protein